MLNDTTPDTAPVADLVHIYVLLHPNKRVKEGYVGQTKQPDKRLRQHKDKAITGNQRPLSRWFREVGEPVMKVVKSVPADQADAAEAEVAEQYRSMGFELLNAKGINKGYGKKHYYASPEVLDCKTEIVAKVLGCKAELVRDALRRHGLKDSDYHLMGVPDLAQVVIGMSEPTPIAQPCVLS